MARQDSPRPSPPSPAYLVLAVAMSATCFTGFWFTYFGPMLAGEYPSVSPSVHLHGWSFFLWYLLLPVQSLLVRSRRLALHRTLGGASLGLAAVMIATGLLVVTVQIHRAAGPGGSPFWAMFGPGVLSTLVVFAVFYVLAIRYRRTPVLHRRYMIVASAGGLGAATFRIMGQVSGGARWAVPAGIMVTALFILAGMARDWIREGRVHSAYARGLAFMLVVCGGSLAVSFLGIAGPINAVAGAIGSLLEPLY